MSFLAYNNQDRGAARIMYVSQYLLLGGCLFFSESSQVSIRRRKNLKLLSHRAFLLLLEGRVIYRETVTTKAPVPHAGGKLDICPSGERRLHPAIGL